MEIRMANMLNAVIFVENFIKKGHFEDNVYCQLIYLTICPRWLWIIKQHSQTWYQGFFCGESLHSILVALSLEVFPTTNHRGPPWFFIITQTETTKNSFIQKFHWSFLVVLLKRNPFNVQRKGMMIFKGSECVFAKTGLFRAFRTQDIFLINEPSMSGEAYSRVENNTPRPPSTFLVIHSFM